MQAEIPPTLKRSTPAGQTTPAGLCPLCQSPLTTQGTPSTPQQTIVMCPGCGYSAPYIQRQQRISEASPAQRQPVGSSVWIDPTVSAYLAGALGSTAHVEQSPSIPFQSHHVQQYSPVAPVSPAQPARPPQRKPSVNPATPIPHRASAQQPDAVKVRPKYSRVYTRPLQQDSDVTRIPTLPPPTMWQYETPSYAAESSLSSLSLVVEAPTHPQTLAAQQVAQVPLPVDECATKTPAPKKHITDIDEIDTLPAHLSQLSPSPQQRIAIDRQQTRPEMPVRPAQQRTDIDKINTLPPRLVPSVLPQSSTGLALTPQEPRPVPVQLHVSPVQTINLAAATAPTEQIAAIGDPSSWTAGGGRESAYARRIADRSHGRKHIPAMHPLDRVRWWLLHPGRLEGMLWLGGTLLLISVTFAFLIVTALSLSWMTPGSQSGNASSLTTVASTPTFVPTAVTSHGLTLILENAGLMVPGQAIQLHGQGFSPRGHITFTDEKQQPLLVQGSQSNAVQADEQGTFAVSLTTSSWAVGLHQLKVYDVVSGRTADLPIILNSGPFGKNVTPTPPTSGTATPNPNNSGNFPTAVNSTPAPITTPTLPPATPTPSPTPVTPTPTATVGITPTATPGITPTVGTTPSPSSSPTTSTQGNNTLATSSTANAATLVRGFTLPNPWLWFLFAGYTLAMLLLGCAGLLLKRRH